MIREKVWLKMEQLQKRQREDKFQLKRRFQYPIQQILDEIIQDKSLIIDLLYSNHKLTEKALNYGIIDCLLSNCNSNKACLQLLALIILRDKNKLVQEYLQDKEITCQTIKQLISLNRD
ncbi:unnamed protein product [Paramecium octaurelia]|uniref:Uncharacterized protein n=1 Tax=Paramecium octaurelia TaxID=43137 RepID=A0A8S1Y2E2_PAROT|nr:unnamed protein product [Paramecium octaurelia]